ncbi:MAG: 8-amino-7-oxononanoate synthase [Deltaproteobacteria bacterium]|nr:8-amino-7-oxononanoate synthase [Deltaproteobacteria bacterium]
MLNISQEIQELQSNNLYRSLKTISSDIGPYVEFQGRKLLNFSSNNYLGLANDHRLKDAAIQATEQFGTSSGASRLITGSMSLHQQLEEKIAQFKNTEAALVFNSGYQANLGIITALLREGDEIYSDELNHASIIDGCRLSKATTKVYRHNDMNHLGELLKSNCHPHPDPLPSRERGQYSLSSPDGGQYHSPLPRGEGAGGRVKRLIVTDSIFSMDGDLAPLQDLAALAEKYDCYLMVDEAHATGVFGKNGKGLVEAIWPDGRPSYLQENLIQMGTFGKALGSFGAYVAAATDVIELLINKARSFIYTTSLPPGVLAASLRAIEIVEQEPERRAKLWENIHHFSKVLNASRLTFHASQISSPIIPILMGSSEKALELSQKLFEQGFWVSAIRYPTVAKGSERLRLTLMASQEKEHLDALAQLLD